MERDDPPAWLVGDQGLHEIGADAVAARNLDLGIEGREAVPVAAIGIVLGRHQYRVIGLAHHRGLAMVEQQLARGIGMGDAAIGIDDEDGDGQCREQLGEPGTRDGRRLRPSQAAARERHGA